MINKYSNVPLYFQLKNLIIDRIETGEFKEETQIPSEQELCEKYDISRPTVRQAINELTNSGYLYKQKGKGTFVAKSKVKVDIKDYSGFTASILDNVEPGHLKIILMKKISASEVPMFDEVFESLGGNIKNEGFALINYVVNQKNDILSFNTSYIPLGLFPEILNDINDKKPSYDILKGKYPLLPVKTKSTIEIVYTSQEEAQFLHIQSGCALIKIDNVLFSKTGQIVEYVVAKYRADKCKILFENNK